jgi:hypothetical protein
MRFRIRELTPRRISDAVQRRLTNIPDVIDWKFSSLGKANRLALEQYKDRHLGKRCFLMANGPSLGSMDLRPISEEITFGLNRIYLIFDRLGFTPTYYGASNELILEQFQRDIRGLQTQKFLGWHRRHLFQDNDHHPPPNTCYLRDRLALSDDFSPNVSDSITSGGTVTYHMLQLAYFMGFQEVILIGLDHSFKEKGRPNRVEVRTGRDENHFHPDYWPKGSRWQLPDLHRTELAYANARRAFEADDRRIIDATIGGKCAVFPKTDFRDILGSAIGEDTTP